LPGHLGQRGPGRFDQNGPASEDYMKKKQKSILNDNLERNVTHALFILPNFVLYSVFSVFPIFYGIYYSLTNWNGIRRNFQFVGIANYVKMFGDSRFLRAIRFNSGYVCMLILCIVVLSVVLGVLLSRGIRARSFFRSAYFFPSIIGLITAGLIFNQIFGHGLPAIGRFLGIPALSKNILADPNIAVFGILFVNVWQGVAIPTILVMAALQTVPGELVESASIDGASAAQVFLHITVPFLLPAISIIIVMVLKEGLMIYDYILALTSGGPAGRTESITMLIMKEGFDESKFSYAIAQAVFLAVVIIIISLLQIEATNKRRVYQ
jgi:raffinose/stachyose/melibiose transport system permease protein